MKNNLFSLEKLTYETSSYELKMFRVQHDETQLSRYLRKYSKIHSKENLNKIYLVRNKSTGQLAAWFGLKSATLPYNDRDNTFLIPAVELTHFAVDERYHIKDSDLINFKTGEYIFRKFILPIVTRVSKEIGCKNLYIFAINTPKLIQYYTKRLGFKEMKNIEEKKFFEFAKPKYDLGCKFLYFPL